MQLSFTYIDLKDLYIIDDDAVSVSVLEAKSRPTQRFASLILFYFYYVFKIIKWCCNWWRLLRSRSCNLGMDKSIVCPGKSWLHNFLVVFNGTKILWRRSCRFHRPRRRPPCQRPPPQYSPHFFCFCPMISSQKILPCPKWRVSISISHPQSLEYPQFHGFTRCILISIPLKADFAFYAFCFVI